MRPCWLVSPNRDHQERDGADAMVQTTSSSTLLPKDVRRVYANVLKFNDHHRLTTYNITNRCNLRCEGCFFYEGDKMSSLRDDRTVDQWRDFFAREKARGIVVCDIAGGEPALNRDRLRLAAEYFEHGIIYSNGIIPIPPDIRFKIHVSLWGDEASDLDVRGAPILRKAIENYRNDPRAVVVYTFNHFNIEHVFDVAQQVHDAGIQLSFNHFSATEQYNAKLSGVVEAKRSKTFKISTPEDNLRLTPEDLIRVRDVCSELMLRYPQTVVYSETINEAVNRPEGVFTVDPQTGEAIDCWSLNAKQNDGGYRNYQTDFSVGRCCLPNTDCSECRVYVVMYGKLIFGTQQALLKDGRLLTQDERAAREALRDPEELVRWLDVVDTWLALSVVGYERQRIYFRKGHEPKSIGSVEQGKPFDEEQREIA